MNDTALNAALEGLESRIRCSIIEQIIRMLEGMLSGGTTTTSAPTVTTPSITKTKRHVSTEGKVRIAATQKKRWKAYRSKKGTIVAAPGPAGGHGRFSDEGWRRLRAGYKKYWAKKRRETKS